MQDPKFFTEHNARHFWHPMAHPAEMREHPPIVVAAAEGVEITDVNGHKALDAVGGLWNVNLGYSCQPIKDAISEQYAQEDAMDEEVQDFLNDHGQRPQEDTMD